MKVYDCFTFFNELELLELRLNLLNNVVDCFVLVESNKTHKNEDKQFNYEKNKEMFAPYADKITYIKVTDMPEYNPDDEWRFENYQRNCITRGLKGLADDDIVFISDIDEIPNPGIIKILANNEASVSFWHRNKLHKNIIQVIKYPECLFKFHGMQLLERTPLALEQKLFYYYVNCQSKGIWSGTVVTKAKNLTSPQKMRDKRKKLPRIKNGGWHFSYLGGAEKILLKINSIVEGPYNLYTKEHINHCINNAIDIYGRKGDEYEYEFINVDETFPNQVKDLVEKYPYLVWGPR